MELLDVGLLLSQYFRVWLEDKGLRLRWNILWAALSFVLWLMLQTLQKVLKLLVRLLSLLSRSSRFLM